MKREGDKKGVATTFYSIFSGGGSMLTATIGCTQEIRSPSVILGNFIKRRKPLLNHVECTVMR